MAEVHCGGAGQVCHLRGGAGQVCHPRSGAMIHRTRLSVGGGAV